MDWTKIDINKIPDGIYYDMPIETYHGNKTHLSASSIKEAYKSIAHFKAYLDKDNERKTHFDFGNAFELSLTDFEGFEKGVAIYDDEEIIKKVMTENPKIISPSQTKKYTEWKSSFYASNADKLIIPMTGEDSLDTLTILKNSFLQHETAVTLVKNCNYQTTIFWTDKDTGLKLKTRPDFWKPANEKRGSIVNDLKTDRNTTADKHIKSMTNNNYPIQAVMQIDGLHNAGLIDKASVAYYWIFCSKNIPHNTEVYDFDSSDIQAFTESYKFKLEEIARAKESGVYLSYDPNRFLGVKSVEFPFWYKRKLGVNNSIDQ